LCQRGAVPERGGDARDKAAHARGLRARRRCHGPDGLWPLTAARRIMTNPEWQADVYHRVSTPQRKWGMSVLDAISFRGDETVLDAGCGTGVQTARILEKLPRGHAVALDASSAMLEVARLELAPFGERVSFVQATLAVDPLPAGLDVVF